MCERNWARKFPNYELRVSARKEKKETAKSLILYVYSLCTFLKNRNQLKRTFFPKKKNASNWLKKVFNIYLHVVGYIFLGPNCDARERGRNYTFFVFHTQIIRRCACVCKKIHFSTMHIHKYSSKKMLFRPGKNNISSNVPAIIICEKHIKNKRKWIALYAGCSLHQKESKKIENIFFSPWNKINHRRKILPKIIW